MSTPPLLFPIRQVRAMYSNPPVHGARIVSAVLSDPALEAEWRLECKAMADRIISMREALQAEILSAGSTKDWGHITKQIGMFCYSCMTKPQVRHMTRRGDIVEWPHAPPPAQQHVHRRRARARPSPTHLCVPKRSEPS